MTCNYILEKSHFLVKKKKNKNYYNLYLLRTNIKQKYSCVFFKKMKIFTKKC
jgi:hypothetical protein